MSRYAAAPLPRSGCAASALRVCCTPASSSEYTATLRNPRAAAARITRIAISPRLATSRPWNGMGRKPYLNSGGQMADPRAGWTH